MTKLLGRTPAPTEVPHISPSLPLSLLNLLISCYIKRNDLRLFLLLHAIYRVQVEELVGLLKEVDPSNTSLHAATPYISQETFAIAMRALPNCR